MAPNGKVERQLTCFKKIHSVFEPADTMLCRGRFQSRELHCLQFTGCLFAVYPIVALVLRQVLQRSPANSTVRSI